MRRRADGPTGRRAWEPNDRGSKGPRGQRTEWAKDRGAKGPMGQTTEGPTGRGVTGPGGQWADHHFSPEQHSLFLNSNSLKKVSLQRFRRLELVYAEGPFKSNSFNVRSPGIEYPLDVLRSIRSVPLECQPRTIPAFDLLHSEPMESNESSVRSLGMELPGRLTPPVPSCFECKPRSVARIAEARVC